MLSAMGVLTSPISYELKWQRKKKNYANYVTYGRFNR